MEADGRVGVLHLISGLGTGGAERMLLWTARHFDRESFDLMVVSLMSGGPMASLIRAEGVQVVEMGQGRGQLSPRALFRLVRLARSFSPSIIQGHLFHSNIISRFVSPFVPGARSVSTRHNEKDSAFRRVLYFVSGFLSAGTIVFSDPVLRHASGDSFAGGPVRLAPYGIDPGTPTVTRTGVRQELGLGPDTFTWIAVGRLTPQKGFDLLIEAFSELRRRTGTPAVLLVVGDGEERKTLEGQAARQVADDTVRFLGSRDDVVNLLGASDAFVLSSRWEGGPLVAMEAMAAGLPVVATRVGDVSRMVTDGETGLVVPPDNVHDLTAAMEKIMSLGDRARLWGDDGKKKILVSCHFTRTQRYVEEIYRELGGVSGR